MMAFLLRELVGLGVAGGLDGGLESCTGSFFVSFSDAAVARRADPRVARAIAIEFDRLS